MFAPAGVPCRVPYRRVCDVLVCPPPCQAPKVYTGHHCLLSPFLGNPNNFSESLCPYKVGSPAGAVFPQPHQRACPRSLKGVTPSGALRGCLLALAGVSTPGSPQAQPGRLSADMTASPARWEPGCGAPSVARPNLGTMSCRQKRSLPVVRPRAGCLASGTVKCWIPGKVGGWGRALWRI